MQKSIKVIVVFVIIAGLISSCAPSQPKISGNLENLFRILVPIDDMNDSFQIYVNKNDHQSLNFGTKIPIIFTNLSEKQIFFPTGFGIKLYVVENNQWLEVQNQVEYWGDRSYLQPKGSQKAGGYLSTVIRPELPSEIYGEKEAILRVVVVGEKINEINQSTPVGAFVDLFIEP